MICFRLSCKIYHCWQININNFYLHSHLWTKETLLLPLQEIQRYNSANTQIITMLRQ